MDPRKPIFLVTHPVVYNTTYGSVDGTYWHTKNLHSVIKDYPQVIVFSGHLHFPLNSERSIFQGDYTTINTAATYYCSLEGEIDGIRPIDTGGMEPRIGRISPKVSILKLTRMVIPVLPEWTFSTRI